MGKRLRIKKELEGNLIESDPLAFTKNRCSWNARMILSNSERINFDIWFDKHYYIRAQHGDENGKRHGIEPEAVKDLVTHAARHLIFYSIKVRQFSFVNFETLNRRERIVLTLKDEDGINLNLIVEYHYHSLNRYEVTVITALRKEAFHFSDGQYQIEIKLDGSSTLLKKERGQIKVIEHHL